MQLYFSKYPEEVQGIILVDSSHPESSESEVSILERYPSLHVFLARCGMIRLFYSIPYVRKKAYETMPSFSLPVQKMCLAQFSTTKYVRTCVREGAFFETSLRQVKEKNISFGSTKLVVIVAGKKSMEEESPQLSPSMSIWYELQRDLLSRSSQATWMVAKKSDHMIPRHQPEVIVQAVRDLINDKQLGGLE